MFYGLYENEKVQIIMKALVIGLAGHNLGDDAIAFTVFNKLKSEGVEVKVTTVNPGRLEKYGINEVYLNRKSVASLCKLSIEILKADLIFVGGGSLIQDKLGFKGFKGVMGFLNQITLMCKLLGKNVISLPIGVDKLFASEKNANKIIKRISQLNVRDQLSYNNAFRYSGVKAKIYPDPAFFIDKYICKNKETSSQEPYCVISLVKENLNEDLFISEIIDYCKRVIEGSKLYIKFVCMDTRATDELIIYNKIVNHLPPERVEIIRNDNLLFIVPLIQEANHILAMRLHALIIGFSHAPMYCLSRTTKTLALCKEYSIPYLDLDGSDKPNFDGMHSFYDKTIKNEYSLEKHYNKKKSINENSLEYLNFD